METLLQTGTDRKTGLPFPWLPVKGLSSQEEQNVGTFHPACSYLLAGLSSRQMSLRGGGSLLPLILHWWFEAFMLGMLPLRIVEPQQSLP